MTKTAHEKAYDAGASAFAKGRGHEANPHGCDTAECKTWEHGYLDRQKVRSDDRPPLGRPSHHTAAAHQ